MKLAPVVASLLLASTLFSSKVLSEDSMPKKIRSIEGITEYELVNGLKILLFPDVSRPTVTVNLTVFVGSRHEGYGEAGMAHLLEHMVFKGTPTFPDIPNLLKERGARFNGTTWLDRTNYYETMAATDDNMELAIRLEADRMINSHIKGEDLASEMTVVRNEFERGENSIQRVLMQKMIGAAFEWHNYGKSTIGNRADIERVPVANLKRFYQRFYQPDNAMLIVAGKFDTEKALAFAQKYFGAIPRPERELDRTYTEEPAQDGDRLVTLRRVGDVPMAGLTYHIPAGGHPDFAAIDVVSTILSSEPSGRLYDSLVKKRQAASASGTTFALHDPGIILFMAEAAQGIDSVELLQYMVDAVEDGAAFTEQEVERARQQLLKRRELSVANSTGVAIGLSDWAAQGDWRLFFLNRDRLEQVSVEDVNRVARQYLVRNNRTAGLFEPTVGAERVIIPPNPNLAEMIGDYEGREEIALGEEFAPSPLAIEARLQRSSINDGRMKVTILPKKTRGETVNLRLSLRYGNLDQLKGKATAAEMLPALLSRGTTNLSRQDIQDELDKYRAQVNIGGGAGRITVSLQTLKSNLPAVLGIVKQMLREPSLPDEELQLLKESQLAAAEQRLTDPTAIANNIAQTLISPYEKDDPRYITTLKEDIERTKAVTIEEIRSVYDSLVQGTDGELTIVGDFDMETAQPVIAEILKDWTSEISYERIPSLANNNTEGSLQHVNTPDKAQATYFSAMTLPIRDDHEDFPALTLGNYILGGGALASRLGNRVRQQEGFSYGVQSALQGSPVDERATFYIYAICAPDKADRVHEVIQEELAKLLKDGITEEELTQQKNGILEQRSLGRTSDGALAGALATLTFAGRTMEDIEKFEDKLRSLTVEDVNAALRKHINPQRLYTVLAGDFEKVAAESASK
ncbi:MAG: pitrilysin family protein [Fuerstiella sp.]